VYGVAVDDELPCDAADAPDVGGFGEGDEVGGFLELLFLW